MSPEIALRLAGGLLLIGANAFFVAVEFALTRLRQFSPDEIDRDDEGLQAAWERRRGPTATSEESWWRS